MSKQFAAQFYHSKEWHAVRSYVLMRDNYLCRDCGRPAEEVHHVVHLTPSNIYNPAVALNPDNLVSLCRDCHFAKHRADQAAGRAERYEKNILPKIFFDEDGNPVAVPQIENR